MSTLVERRCQLRRSTDSAERALRESQRELRAILDTVQAMIWYKDSAGKVLRYNRAAEGTPAEGLSQAEAEVLRSGQPRLRHVEQQGGKWLRKDIIPNLSGGLITFAMDITEIKRAEELQRGFVANVSHELRTPVAAIKGFAETLRAGALGDKRNRMRFVRIIESHADRLSWLVEDLMTISALEGGRELELFPLALAPAARELIEGLAPVAKGRRVSLECRVPARLKVLADTPHLLQALENLISNAMKFNRPGGWVRLEARRDGVMARLTVRDGGIGIPEQHLDRVFERFYRVKKGAEPGSSGLGLHIVRRIAEAHGGRAWVESRAGCGSAFHVTVPLA